ncbi:MAG: recombinase family protein [Planctomycetes bacterium]|nr:recombinase family protein [Planctomycetota bacterium]
MGSAWTRTTEERAELVAKARAWQGTQREFAEAHGVSQPTVSKWMSAAPPTTRPATADLRSEVARRYRAGEGSQRQIADAMGISRGMVFKWLAAEAAPRSPAARPPRVPTMLEVVPVAAPPLATAEPSPPFSACLCLPGGAELRFDALPSARWVAELAAELARC